MDGITEWKEFLRANESMSGAVEGDLTALLSGADYRRINPGTVLIREGEKGEFAWVLISGELVVFAGEEEINRINTPGELFGEISAVSHSAATATVSAETEVEALAIPHDHMHRVMENSPSLAASVLRSMAKYLGKR